MHWWRTFINWLTERKPTEFQEAVLIPNDGAVSSPSNPQKDCAHPCIAVRVHECNRDKIPHRGVCKLCGKDVVATVTWA